jgi:hypothetical protein
MQLTKLQQSHVDHLLQAISNLTYDIPIGPRSRLGFLVAIRDHIATQGDKYQVAQFLACFPTDAYSVKVRGEYPEDD